MLVKKYNPMKSVFIDITDKMRNTIEYNNLISICGFTGIPSLIFTWPNWLFLLTKSEVCRFNQFNYQNNFERGWHHFAVQKHFYGKLFSPSERFSINALTSKTIWTRSRSFQQLHLDVKRKER